MDKQWLFDREWTRDFTKARETTLRTLLNDLQMQADLHSALDVGCGVGDFSKFLTDLGFRVVAVDGRQQNVDEAKRRYPEITFVVADADELCSVKLGKFDLVLCFGLLYHLENPFRTIRELHSSTGKVLAIEGMCVPDANPTMSLFDEAPVEDQSLNSVAFYPSEPCLIKMLYRAGFPFVYSLKKLPDNNLYVESIWRKRVRTMLVASKQQLDTSALVLSGEKFFMPPDTSSVWAKAEWNPWTTLMTRICSPCKSALSRIRAIGSRAWGLRSRKNDYTR